MVESRKNNKRPIGPAAPQIRQPKRGGRRISRACDTCKVKKRKCDGSDPCESCRINGATCAYETKRYKDAKHELIHMHYLLDEGLQVLYQACVSRKGFPGVAPLEYEGKASTLSILEQLGIIHHPIEEHDYKLFLSAPSISRSKTSVALGPSTSVDATPSSGTLDSSDDGCVHSTATNPPGVVTSNTSQTPIHELRAQNSRRILDTAVPGRPIRPRLQIREGPPSPSSEHVWRRSDGARFDHRDHNLVLSPLSTAERDHLPKRAKLSRPPVDSSAVNASSELDRWPLLQKSNHMDHNLPTQQQQSSIFSPPGSDYVCSSTVSDSSGASIIFDAPDSTTMENPYTLSSSDWPSNLDFQAHQYPLLNGEMTMNLIQQSHQQIYHQSPIFEQFCDPFPLQTGYTDVQRHLQQF